MVFGLFPTLQPLLVFGVFSTLQPLLVFRVFFHPLATSGVRSFFPPFSHFWCRSIFSTIRRALNSSHSLVSKGRVFQSLVWQIFCSKFLECPHSSISGMLVWSENADLDRSWHPPPPAPDNSDLDRSWHFGLSWCGPSPTSPKHSDLNRSWHFGLSWYGPHTPHPHPQNIQIWTDFGTLG